MSKQKEKKPRKQNTLIYSQSIENKSDKELREELGTFKKFKNIIANNEKWTYKEKEENINALMKRVHSIENERLKRMRLKSRLLSIGNDQMNNYKHGKGSTLFDNKHDVKISESSGKKIMLERLKKFDKTKYDINIFKEAMIRYKEASEDDKHYGKILLELLKKRGIAKGDYYRSEEFKKWNDSFKQWRSNDIKKSKVKSILQKK